MPPATITTPTNGGAYSEGSEIVFNGLASSDPDNDFLTYTMFYGADWPDESNICARGGGDKG